MMPPGISIVGALLAGLAAGGHCAVMCGGIAGALGLSSRAAAKRAGRAISYPLLYNVGRIASYALAGALVGGVGSGLLLLGHADRIRALLQALSGVILAVVGLRLMLGARGFGWLDAWGMQVWRRLAPLTRHVLPISSPPRALLAGMLWGWLPCGMAYAMLIAAWLSADAGAGALIMLAFGLGTVPWLVAAGAAAQSAALVGADRRWRRAGGAIMAVLGLVALLSPLLFPHATMAGALAGLAACLPALGR